MFINNFNLLEISVWSIIISYLLIIMFISGIINIDYSYTNNNLILTLILILVYICIEWFIDIIIEGNNIGRHIYLYRLSLYIGFLLYILSEVFIFLSLFIGYINIIISPSIYIGNKYSNNIIGYNRLGLSILNLLILVLAGIYISISVYENRYKYILLYMIYSLLLCILFSSIQYYEYIYSEINITDSTYGTYFYSTSGLHGIHMIIGEFIIYISIYKLLDNNTIIDKKISIYVSSINIHFLDICLLFIYILVY